jgi:hypothetical protein
MTTRRKLSATDRSGTFITGAGRSWVTVSEHEFRLHIGTSKSDDGDDTEVHEAVFAGFEEVRVVIKNGGRQYVSLDLSSMTAEELTAIRDFMNRCIDAALPLAEVLDARAHEALERDDPLVPARVYRMRPVEVVRNLKIKNLDAAHKNLSLLEGEALDEIP